MVSQNGMDYTTTHRRCKSPAEFYQCSCGGGTLRHNKSTLIKAK